MEIVVSTEAQQHILQISEYLQEIYGEIVANKAYEEIMERIQLLAMFPQMGVLQEDIKVGNDFEMRSVVSKPNVVYYALSQSKQKIVIIAILDSRQSPETIRKIISTILISNFHEDWGGNGSPDEIAEELRKTRCSGNREIEAW